MVTNQSMFFFKEFPPLEIEIHLWFSSSTETVRDDANKPLLMGIGGGLVVAAILGMNLMIMRSLFRVEKIVADLASYRRRFVACTSHDANKVV